jgi:hypothetical protein
MSTKRSRSRSIKTIKGSVLGVEDEPSSTTKIRNRSRSSDTAAQYKDTIEEMKAAAPTSLKSLKKSSVREVDGQNFYKFDLSSKDGCMESFMLMKWIENNDSNPDQLASRLQAVGVPQEKIVNTYTYKGIQGLAELFQDACTGKEVVNTRTDLKKMAADATRADMDVLKMHAAAKMAKKRAREQDMLNEDQIELATKVAMAAVTGPELDSRLQIDANRYNISRSQAELGRISERINEQQAEFERKLAGTMRTGQKLDQQNHEALVDAARTAIAVPLANEIAMQNKLQRTISAQEAIMQAQLMQHRDITSEITLDQKLFNEIASSVYGNDVTKIMEELPVRRIITDEKGKPDMVQIDANKGGISKLAAALTGIYRNQMKNHEKCAAVLTKYNITNKQSWEKLLDYLSSETDNKHEIDERKQLAENIQPCLSDAFEMMRISTMSKLSKKLDEKGFVVYDDNALTKLEQEIYGKTVTGKVNRFLPKLVTLDEKEANKAKVAAMEWSKSLLDRERRLKLEALQDFLKYSTVGSGYTVGSSPVIVEPVKRMHEMFAQMLDNNFKDTDTKKAFVSEMKTAFLSMGAMSPEVQQKKLFRPWKDLSRNTRHMLRLQSLITNQVIRHLESANNTTDNLLTTESTKQIARMFPSENFSDSRRDFAEVSEGAFDTEDTMFQSTHRDEFKTMFKAFSEKRTRFSERSEGGAESGSRRLMRVYFALIKAFNAIFGFNLHCDEDGKPKSVSFYMGNLFKTLDNVMKSHCLPTARTYDTMLYESKDEVMKKEVKLVYPLPLVEFLLRQMDLPCSFQLKYRDSVGSNMNCALINDLLLTMLARPNTAMKKALENIRAVFKDQGDIDCSIPSTWEDICSKCIVAAQHYQIILHNFMTMPRFTRESLMQHMQRGLMTISSQFIVDENIKGTLPEGDQLGFPYEKQRLTILPAMVQSDEGKDFPQLQKEISLVKSALKNWVQKENKILSYHDVLNPRIRLRGGWVGGELHIPVALPSSFISTCQEHLLSIDPITLATDYEIRKAESENRSRASLLTDWENGKDFPILLRTLGMFFYELISFRHIAMKPDDNNLLELGPDVFRQQLIFFRDQIKHLCLLPESQCRSQGSTCIFVDSKCVIPEYQRLQKKDGKYDVKWNPGVVFSTTGLRTGGNAMTTSEDIITLGWDSVQEKLLSVREDKEFLKMIEKQRVLYAIGEYTKVIGSTSLSLTTAPDGAEIVNDLVKKISDRRKVLSEILKLCDSGSVNKFIDACALLMERSIDSKNKSMFRTNKHVYNTSNFLAGYMELLGVLISPEEMEVKLKDAVFQVEGRADYNIKGMGFPSYVAIEVLQQVMIAHFVHFSEISDVRCDLDETRCKAVEGRGGQCRWDKNKCYNGLFQSLKGETMFRTQLGILDKSFNDRAIQLLRNPLLAKSSEDHGIIALISAIYGDEFVRAMPYLSPSDAAKAIADVLKYDIQTPSQARASAVPLPPLMPNQMPLSDESIRKSEQAVFNDFAASIEAMQKNIPTR